MDAPAVKPGFKTTEFWITVAVWIVGLVLMSGAVCNASDTPTAALVCKGLGVAAIVFKSIGYDVSRGLTKAGAGPAT